jgi:sugar/nucleoside kinase (ribokinase family)
MDNKNTLGLTIIGDVGVDVVLGPIERWPAIGTESLMDRSELRAGGSAGNAALAASYLGTRPRMLSLVGDDSLGAWLTEQFRGLDASLPVCSLATSMSVGIIHSCGERTFFTTRGHLEAFGYEHVAPHLARARQRDSIALLSGAFLTPKLRQSYGRLIDELSAPGYQIALDTGWPSGDWHEELREEMFGWVAKCDHVLLNEIEIASLGNCTDLSAAMAKVSRRLKPGASLIAKTGAQGAVGYQDGATMSVGAVASAVFDTVGAGDAFNAGYLLARLNGQHLAPALESGCQAAASIITRFPRRSIRPGEFAGQFELPRRRVAGEG